MIYRFTQILKIAKYNSDFGLELLKVISHDHKDDKREVEYLAADRIGRSKGYTCEVKMNMYSIYGM